jgi:hypothetical protein
MTAVDERTQVERRATISGAEHLHGEGRSRSAATLIVGAFEQLGWFVEALTKETYPDAAVHSQMVFRTNRKQIQQSHL